MKAFTSLLSSPSRRRVLTTVSSPCTRQSSFPHSSRHLATLRRPRKKYEQFVSPMMGTHVPIVSTGMEEPLDYSKDGSSLEDYASNKATLSPWTPVPDSVARKIFDRADPTSEDVHVELGSGDGRVNFFAIEAGVHRSIGIDVDENIVQVANDRLNRIHPKPNLEFLVADLIDTTGKNYDTAWKHVQDATILTMYFAKDGLEKIRPLLENALRGKRCKIFACGYAMPGWESQVVETVLDMPIHFYDWGNADVEDAILTDRFVENIPMGNNSTMQAMDKFAHRNKKSTFKPDPLKGFHPDDLIDYHWDDFAIKDENKKV